MPCITLTDSGVRLRCHSQPSFAADFLPSGILEKSKRRISDVHFNAATESKVYGACKREQAIDRPPPVICERLEPHLQRVRLEAGRVLFDVGATIDHTWFIASGIVSLIGVTENGNSVEVAMAGHNDVIGFPGTWEKNESVYRAQAQIAGEAFRVDTRVLQAAIKRESQIYLPLLDQTHILNRQIAQAAVCNNFHTIDQRLARWLLLARDKTRYGVFNLTHEVMAHILGVSRSGVTSAANSFQSQGLIRYSRGRITLLNPEGLKPLSCECYRIISRTTGELFIPN